MTSPKTISAVGPRFFEFRPAEAADRLFDIVAVLNAIQSAAKAVDDDKEDAIFRLTRVAQESLLQLGSDLADLDTFFGSFRVEPLQAGA